MNKYVALQYYGLMRGFHFEETRNLIYERIIKQLERQGYTVHIFLHTYDLEYLDHDQTKIQRDRDFEVKLIESLDKSMFDIKHYEVDSDYDIDYFLKFTYDLENQYNFYPHWDNPAKFGWFKFVFSMSKVNSFRLAYENEHNIQYDWVILTSPQMEPQNYLEDLTLLDKNYMYSPGYAFFGGYYTSFFFGNSEHINYISFLWNYMIEKKFKHDAKHKNFYCFEKCLIDSEPIFKYYIDLKYTMMPILNIRFNRVRFNGFKVDH